MCSFSIIAIQESRSLEHVSILDPNKLQHKIVNRAHSPSENIYSCTSIEPRNIRTQTVRSDALNFIIMLTYLKRKGHIF